MQCLQRIWDQTVAIHSKAKNNNQNTLSPWKFWPQDHWEGHMATQEQSDPEPFIQDLASWQTYKGRIWDAMRWAVAPVETACPLWENAMESKTMQRIMARPTLFLEFWAGVNLLNAVGHDRRHCLQDIINSMTATRNGAGEF